MTPTDTLSVPTLAAILRRYCFAYTASHDPSVCDEIMVDDYALHMGEFHIRGRDENYKPAALKQYRQFPGLGMSVHELLITAERAAMHFSEYGRSVLTDTTAAWSGISTYHWNGERLLDCHVEQDYFGRRRQLRSGTPNPVVAPAHDPWTTAVEASDPAVESIAREWISAGGLADVDAGSMDDEAVAVLDRITLVDARYDVLDCFSGDGRAAFHVRATGTVASWPGAAEGVLGKRTYVYYSGIVRVDGGNVVGARVISDRLAAERRALSAEG